VLIDGAPKRSCRTKVADVGERGVTTIESLERDGKLHPVQEAFLKEDAMQCGYCTCGMIMAAYALLQRSKNPSESDIVTAMNGNVCRCGTYQRIVAAIQKAAKQVNGNGGAR
jgi:aerobic-type carbon monoxide dehydrogenase small subunit (CoxS/CutS family)